MKTVEVLERRDLMCIDPFGVVNEVPEIPDVVNEGEQFWWNFSCKNDFFEDIDNVPKRQASGNSSDLSGVVFIEAGVYRVLRDGVESSFEVLDFFEPDQNIEVTNHKGVVKIGYNPTLDESSINVVGETEFLDQQLVFNEYQWEIRNRDSLVFGTASEENWRLEYHFDNQQAFVGTTIGTEVLEVVKWDDDGNRSEYTVTVTLEGTRPLIGDLDHDRDVDQRDRDLLIASFDRVGWGYCGDVDRDGDVDHTDQRVMADALGLKPGDVNADGLFSSGDLIKLFQVGAYDTDLEVGFFEGDFDGDGRFDSSDLVFALQNNRWIDF